MKKTKKTKMMTIASKEILLKLQEKSSFTAPLSFEEYIFGLCKRYTRMHREILPVNDYNYILYKLIESKEVSPDELNDLIEEIKKSKR